MYRVIALILIASSVFGASNRYNPKKDTLGVTDGRVLEVKGTALLDTDSSKFIWQDTTITGFSVYKVVPFDLTDPAQMWDLDRFRQLEQNGSLSRTEGIRLPDRGYWVVTASKDSVLCVDEYGTEVLAFLAASGYFNSSQSVNDLAFLDGILYFASTNGVWMADFATDESTLIIAGAGTYHRITPLSGRNTNSTWGQWDSSVGIVNNTVNAVAVTRSPYIGHTDEFGRQWHYWAVGTDGGYSFASYDKDGTLSIYDEDASRDGISAIKVQTGFMLAGEDASGADNGVDWIYSVLPIDGDIEGVDEVWNDAGSGSEDLGTANAVWGTGVSISDLDVVAEASPNGNNSPRVIVGSDEGLLIADAKFNDNTQGTRTYITNTQRTPGLLGSVKVAISGASSADPTGQHPWSAVGGVTYVSNTDGPGGSHINLVAASEQYLYIPDHADFGGLATFSAGGWLYRDIDSGNPEGIFGHYDNTNNDDDFRIYIAGTGDLISFQVDATTNDLLCQGPAIATGAWYRVDATYDGTNQRLYLNGELVDTEPQSGSTDGSAEPLVLGVLVVNGVPVASTYFDGRLWGWYLTTTVASPEWIKAQYQAGLANIQSPYDGLLHSVDVDYVDACGSAFVTGDEDSVTVHSPDGTIQARYGSATIGSINDASCYSVPGIDSVGVAFGGGDTGLRLIGPDPRMAAVALTEWPAPPRMIGSVAVVDSAGMGDFVKITDAVDSQNNLSRKSVYVMRGTYGDPITGVFKGLQLWGDGPKTLVTNSNSTSNEAITVDADSCIIKDMAFSTATGGDGGNEEAFLLDGDGNAILRVVIEDSDTDAFTVADGEANNLFSGCIVNDADGIAWRIDGPSNRLEGNVVFSTASSGVFLTDTGDQCVLVGNWIDGGGQAILVDAAGENQLIVGNSTDAAVSDKSGTSTVASNEEF